MPIMRMGHRFCHLNRFRRLFKGGYRLYLGPSGRDMVNGSRKCAEISFDKAPSEVGGSLVDSRKRKSTVANIGNLFLACCMRLSQE
jgi:hypothetical protein